MLAMGESLLWPRVLVRCCTPPSDVVRMLNVQHGSCMLHQTCRRNSLLCTHARWSVDKLFLHWNSC